MTRIDGPADGGDRLLIATAIWQAWMELNAIRARDGVPYMRDGWKASISEEYFSKVVDDCEAAYTVVTGTKIMPWPPTDTALAARRAGP